MRRLVPLLLFALATAVYAEALLKPVPQPQLDGVPKERASALADARAKFDQIRTNLVGADLAAAYAEIGALYARENFADAADVALYDATQLAPEDGRWVYLQGVLADSRQQPAVALGYFERAFKLNADYVPIRVALATALLGQGAVDRAMNLVDEYLARAKDQPKVYALKGDIALRRKRYGDAVAAYEQALKLDPKASKLQSALAEAYAGEGNAAAAAQARGKAGDVPPRLADPLGLSVLPASAAVDSAATSDPLSRAAFFFVAGQFPTARNELDAALRQKPDDPAALALYARVEAMAGNAAAAQTRIAAALKIAPRNAVVLMTQGVVLETAANDEGARGWYEKAVNADPAVIEARLLLGNALMRHGQFGQAAEQYRQLARLEPDKAEHYARLAAALTVDGHCEIALKDIGAALGEHPKLGGLVQVFMRVASTCRAATAADRARAMDAGERLYRQRPTPPNSEALALVAAATGRWDDAVQIQAAAIFDVVKGNDQAEIALYKQFFRKFEAKQMPDRPWPADHPLYAPAALRALPPIASAAR